MDGWKLEGPWLTTDIHGWQVKILKGSGPMQGILDVELLAPDRRRFAAEIGTLEDIRRIMGGHSRSGESLSGSYLYMQNLIILKELSEPFIRRVLDHMIRSNEIESAFDLLELS
jgi:hypothetical protein